MAWKECDVYYTCALKNRDLVVSSPLRGKVRNPLIRWEHVNENSDETKDVFYDQLERTINTIPTYDM